MENNQNEVVNSTWQFRNLDTEPVLNIENLSQLGEN
jgi:hypothetical protein